MAVMVISAQIPEEGIPRRGLWPGVWKVIRSHRDLMIKDKSIERKEMPAAEHLHACRPGIMRNVVVSGPPMPLVITPGCTEPLPRLPSSPPSCPTVSSPPTPTPAPHREKCCSFTQWEAQGQMVKQLAYCLDSRKTRSFSTALSVVETERFNHIYSIISSLQQSYEWDAVIILFQYVMQTQYTDVCTTTYYVFIIFEKYHLLLCIMRSLV